MLRAKIDGTVLLERLTDGQQLDFWFFSHRLRSAFGGWGFAHYSAANVFLDATAQTADQNDCRVLTVDWGAWERRSGLSSPDGQRLFRESGFEPMRGASRSTLLDGYCRVRSHRRLSRASIGTC